ncbi:rhomboid protein putative membrane-associated serine peptidase [Clostridium sp. CAG:628]|nr:rhomboid protein putative membrane-associated serine peptidase [Clostridium sp. CAG:628]
MNKMSISKEDTLVMKLIHYFVTNEDYRPIVVHGVQNEIWLENLDNDIPLIRINSNYIHNEEQLMSDLRKVEVIRKTIKKKTYSFRSKVLNLLMNTRDEVTLTEEENVLSIKVKNITELKKNKFINDYFPNFKEKVVSKNNGIVDVLEMTEELNKKTIKEDNELAKIFLKKDQPIVTYSIILLNIIVFMLSLLDYNMIINCFANYYVNVKNGEIYRLLTACFVHANFLHIFFNMYALYYIGPMVEKYYGKLKYLLIYLGSGIMGSLFSVVLSNNVSIGASGAIFGLFGSMLYFGYKYRATLDGFVRSGIIPVLFINLILGFIVPNIDVYGHIGGLVGGLLLSYIVGVYRKCKKKNTINGLIIITILIASLSYMLIIK